MSFSKAQILTLCSTLSNDLENDTTISRFFDELVEALSLAPFPIFVKYALVSLSSGTATYNYESGMLRLIHAIMSDASISIEDDVSLSDYDQTWTASSGTPIAVKVSEANRQYTLYPNPNFTTGAAGAEPLGEDYPDDPLFIFYAEDRASSIADCFGLPVALLTLAAEFRYDSLHENQEFSSACDLLGNFLMQIVS